jgi:hypothetical protein
MVLPVKLGRVPKLYDVSRARYSQPIQNGEP